MIVFDRETTFGDHGYDDVEEGRIYLTEPHRNSKESGFGYV